MCEIEKPSSHISAAFTMQSSGSIGLCLVSQTRPLCIASYAFSVRQTGSLPVSALRSLHIRLPSDSTSRWTPLPSANSSYCQVCGGLSPPSYCPCRAHKQKTGPFRAISTQKGPGFLCAIFRGLFWSSHPNRLVISKSECCQSGGGEQPCLARSSQYPES